MDFAEDPALRDIRREFLGEVTAIHAQHAFTGDVGAIAQALGLEVREDAKNLYIPQGDSGVIVLNRSETGPRRTFSFAHELAHHLFRATEGYYQDTLRDLFYGAPPSLVRRIEEVLCDEAAALLIFPDHHVSEQLLRLGVTPEAVFRLATMRNGSLQAAIIRVLGALDATDVWGYVVNRDNRVAFTWTKTRYRPSRDTPIDPNHPMQAAWSEPVDLKAALPRKRPTKPWNMPMRAATNGKRLVTLFARKFPTIPDDNQPPLFPPGAIPEAAPSD